MARSSVFILAILLCSCILTQAEESVEPKNYKRKEENESSWSKFIEFFEETFVDEIVKHRKIDPIDPIVNDTINLHIVPHSHTDAGWIETIDWYYNQKIVHIFKNIVEELDGDHSLKFIWADTNFLHQWFESQKSSTQEKFMSIVKRGQIEFVGGGWVQNDESLSDLKSIINQMNLGLQYLHDRFNATPTVGWQIDPFGYNHFMPSVFKELGFEYLVLNRIGDIHKEEFKANRSMDFWLESADIGDKESKILTHVLPRHYEPFNYDDLIDKIPKEKSSDKTKEEFVQYFYDTYLKKQMQGFSTEEYMLLMGKDFGFSMKKGILGKIKIMNKILTQYSPRVLDIKINAKFSFPSEYFEAIKESKRLTTKNLDFVNYDERLVYLHPSQDEKLMDYWVGYYSTRPHLKKMINQAFNNFRTLETLITYITHIGKFKNEFKEKFLSIETQLSYLLHHDAITGTSRKATIDDYYSRVDESERNINDLINEVNSILLGERIEVVKDQEMVDIKNQSIYYFNQASYTRKIVVKIPNTGKNVRLFDFDLKKYAV